MKAARYHQPDWLSDPERYAQRHCRGSDPPNEERRGDEPRRSSASKGQGAAQRHITTYSGVAELAQLYGRREGEP